MRPNTTLHGIALISLLTIAVMSVTGALRVSYGSPVIYAIIAMWFWAFIIWKIWFRPRRWGLGVGVLLLLIIGFQTYLWTLTRSNPALPIHDSDPGIGTFLLHEIPLAIGAITCVLLRFSGSKQSSD
jgi:hypothetical protein